MGVEACENELGKLKGWGVYRKMGKESIAIIILKNAKIDLNQNT